MRPCVVVESRAEDPLAGVLGAAVLMHAFWSAFPTLGHQAQQRLAAGQLAGERLFPPLAADHAVARVDVEKDVVVERGILVNQPPFERDRLAIVFARMAQKDPWHEAFSGKSCAAIQLS